MTVGVYEDARRVVFETYINPNNHEHVAENLMHLARTINEQTTPMVEFSVAQDRNGSMCLRTVFEKSELEE